VGNFVKCHQAGKWAIDHAKKIKIPVLILHGNDDKITGINGSGEFAAKGGKKVELKIWQGLRHEPHHEKEKDVVIRFIKDWILVNSQIVVSRKS
jgi:alpha-beta hydrolase superfamily lysophospholipase